MNHFLDIHKTDPDALTGMIGTARDMKEAAQAAPKARRMTSSR